MAISFEVTANPQPDALDTVGKGLSGFNEADAGPANRVPLAVFARSDDDTIAAGISGYTAWGWLYVQWLWVAEDFRGQGLAGRMLVLAEDEARHRGCHGAYIDTFNPQALKAYQRAGYQVFGELPDFPKGRVRSFLSKNLG